MGSALSGRNPRLGNIEDKKTPQLYDVKFWESKFCGSFFLYLCRIPPGMVIFVEDNIAKKIFQKYKGMFFFMIREGNGDYEQYRSFGISKTKEREWLLEMQAEFLEKMENAREEKLQLKYLRDYADVSRELNDQHAFQFLLEYAQENAFTWDTKTLASCIGEVYQAARMMSFPNDGEKRKFISSIFLMLDTTENSTESTSNRQAIVSIRNDITRLISEQKLFRKPPTSWAT